MTASCHAGLSAGYDLDAKDPTRSKGLDTVAQMALTFRSMKPWTSLLCPVLDSTFQAFWQALGCRPFHEPSPHVTLLRRIPIVDALHKWDSVHHDRTIMQATLQKVRLIRRQQYDVLLVDLECQDLSKLLDRLKDLFPNAVAEPLHITLGYFEKGHLNYMALASNYIRTFFVGRKLYLGELRSHQIWSGDKPMYWTERIGLDIKELDRPCHKNPRRFRQDFWSQEQARTVTAVQ